MIIYVDVLLAVNLIITYFMLLASAILAGCSYNRKRIITASVTGALFCLYIFVQSNNIIFDFFVKIVSLLVCSLVAFGKSNKRRYIVQTVCFVCLNAMLTGVLTLFALNSKSVYTENMVFYLDINPVLLVLLSLIIYLIIVVFSCVKEELSPQYTYCIDIEFDNFKLNNICAFYDSGCKVKDLITNKEVMIISYEKTEKLLPYSLNKDISLFFNEDYKNIKSTLTPIFFNTINGRGMLPAIKSRYVKCGEKIIKDVLIAFTEDMLCENASAIFGLDIKKQL